MAGHGAESFERSTVRVVHRNDPDALGPKLNLAGGLGRGVVPSDERPNIGPEGEHNPRAKGLNDSRDAAAR